MKKALFVIFSFLVSFTYSQEEKTLSEIADKLRLNLDKITLQEHDSSGNLIVASYSKLKNNVKEDFGKYLDFIKAIEKQKRLKGSISFGFSGSEVDNSNLFIIQTGMEASYGVYPLEIEAKTNIQTQVSDGKFEENLSSLDISMDYHPFEDLTHEAYAFIKRTKNKFLGINQRYEIGGGYLINLYSAKYINDEKINGITEKGGKLLKKIEKWKKKYSEENLKKLHFTKCLKKYCKDTLLLEEEAVDKIFSIKEDHEKVIKKLNSKHRLALLLGINYEIERTQDSLSLFSNDTILKNNFEPTSLFRLVIAPKYELTGDRFKWKNVIYFKMGLFGTVDDIYTNEKLLIDPTPNNILTNKKSDYWLDFTTSFEFKFAKKLTLVTSLNYIYDNAPKRQYFEDINGIQKIAKAENRFTGINFNLKYTF